MPKLRIVIIFPENLARSKFWALRVPFKMTFSHELSWSPFITLAVSKDHIPCLVIESKLKIPLDQLSIPLCLRGACPLISPKPVAFNKLKKSLTNQASTASAGKQNLMSTFQIIGKYRSSVACPKAQTFLTCTGSHMYQVVNWEKGQKFLRFI